MKIISKKDFSDIIACEQASIVGHKEKRTESEASRADLGGA